MQPVVLYEPSPSDVVDPIAAQWELAQKAVKPAGEKVNALATHLPMGADKWGRDNNEPFFAASAGQSAIDTVWLQALAAEQAVHT